jgi:hypothetical protein
MWTETLLYYFLVVLAFELRATRLCVTCAFLKCYDIAYFPSGVKKKQQKNPHHPLGKLLPPPLGYHGNLSMPLQ